MVTDYYIAGFLPLVGDVVPNLAVELKNEHGEPVELDETVITNEDNELKVWQAVLQYTLSHELGENGLPVIPADYETTQDRMRQVQTLPIWIWPALILFLIVSVIIYFFRRRKKS